MSLEYDISNIRESIDRITEQDIELEQMSNYKVSSQLISQLESSEKVILRNILKEAIANGVTIQPINTFSELDKIIKEKLQ